MNENELKAVHTPGPWVIGDTEADVTVKASDGRTFVIGDRIYHPENFANGRLIAAAPELLEACRMAEGFHGGRMSAMEFKRRYGVSADNIGALEMCLSKLRAALTKAEGLRSGCPHCGGVLRHNPGCPE